MLKRMVCFFLGHKHRRFDLGHIWEGGPCGVTACIRCERGDWENMCTDHLIAYGRAVELLGVEMGLSALHNRCALKRAP